METERTQNLMRMEQRGRYGKSRGVPRLMVKHIPVSLSTATVPPVRRAVGDRSSRSVEPCCRAVLPYRLGRPSEPGKSCPVAEGLSYAPFRRLPAAERGNTAGYYTLAAVRRSSTALVCSHVNSGSSRPKCP